MNTNGARIPWADIPRSNLDLALGPLRVDEGIAACGDLDPVHPDDLRVNHES